MDVNFKTDKSPQKLKEGTELDDISMGLKSLKIMDKEFLENSSYGNIQYTLKVMESDFMRVKSEMVYRLEEGDGHCYFEIGLDHLGEKIGLPELELKSSIENLEKIAYSLDSTLEILKFYRGRLGLIAEVVIKVQSNLKSITPLVTDSFLKTSICPNVKKNSSSKTLEIKIGLFGEETSGKSTLLGVLVNNTLDDGEGSARHNIFRFQHEIQCGKTSSLSHQIIGFDEKGNLITQNNSMNKNYEEILLNSSKIISFYDLGGSEKAFKTTLSTLSPNYLDYFFLVISARQGITENTKLFLMLANSMNLPMVTLITMSDLVNQSDIEELIKNYKFLIKNLKHKKVPLVVSSLEDIMLFSRNLNENINPAIIISNKTGYGYDYLVNFLSTLILPKMVGDDLHNTENKKNIENVMTGNNYINQIWQNDDINNFTDFTNNPCQFDIHENFMVEGRLIIGGIVSKGKIMVGNKYYLGPCKNGDFIIVEVNDIHCKKISTNIAYQGQFSSLSLIKTDTFSGLKYDDIRKGMSLLDVNMSIPYACRSFQAEIWSLDGGTKTIKYKYEPVVTIKHVRQTCKLKKVLDCKFENNFNDDEYENHGYECDDLETKLLEFNYYKTDMSYGKLSTNSTNISETSNSSSFTISPEEKILINLEFKNYPEYITPGSYLIISDGCMKAFGVVVKINK